MSSFSIVWLHTNRGLGERYGIEFVLRVPIWGQVYFGINGEILWCGV